MVDKCECLVSVFILKHQNQIVFIETNEEEQDCSGQHPQSVESRVPPVSSLQLGHHGHQSNVEEDSHRGGEQPGWESSVWPQHQTRDQTKKCEDWGDTVVQHCRLHWHPGVEEEREVTHFMRQLVAEDSDAGGEPRGETERECCTNSDTISEVVDSVANDDHQAWHWHGAEGGWVGGQTLVAVFSLIQTVQTAHTLSLGKYLSKSKNILWTFKSFCQDQKYWWSPCWLETSLWMLRWWQSGSPHHCSGHWAAPLEHGSDPDPDSPALGPSHRNTELWLWLRTLSTPHQCPHDQLGEHEGADVWERRPPESPLLETPAPGGQCLDEDPSTEG